VRDNDSGPRVSPARGAAAVVLASGSGVRAGGGRNKVYLPLGGPSVVSWSLRTFAGIRGVAVLVLVIRPQDAEQARRVLAAELSDCPVEIVHGGAARHDSELLALRHLAPRIAAGELDVVLMHDAARPLVTPALVSAVLAAARESGGAVPGVPRDGLMMVSEDGRLAESDLGTMMAMQTPQGFAAGPLLEAYEKAAAAGFAGTDTAAFVARYSDLPVRCIPGEDSNIKITYPHDLMIAAQRAAARHGRRQALCVPWRRSRGSSLMHDHPAHSGSPSSARIRPAGQIVAASVPRTSSQPGPTCSATCGIPAASSSRRSWIRVSVVAPPGASRSVIVSSES
jgi:2-C-methyl-D-erythritol 4-phosphate cytidylyltransferase